jgi:indole-3-glycerol phosphate synthase
MILDRIIQNKKNELEKAKQDYPLELISSQIEEAQPPKDFFKALESNGRVKIIAEIKCASPSKGIFRKDFNPTDIAREYSEGGASAISILTDRQFFKGDLIHLRNVRKAVETPLLRKDFIIDPYQIYEARLYGADAVLLIASVLDIDKLAVLLDLTHSLSMNAIVEVHDEGDLEKALLVESRIIGINNRDLRTFHVSLEASMRLSRLVSGEKIVVAESGIHSSEDIKMLKEEGIYVFLIGETFMKAESPGKELAKLLSSCA